MKTWKHNAWMLWNVNETNVRMHSDAKVIAYLTKYFTRFLKAGNCILIERMLQKESSIFDS